MRYIAIIKDCGHRDIFKKFKCIADARSYYNNLLKEDATECDYILCENLNDLVYGLNHNSFNENYISREEIKFDYINYNY